jgi:uncharacterized delta-60 repeat protein
MNRLKLAFFIFTALILVVSFENCEFPTKNKETENGGGGVAVGNGLRPGYVDKTFGDSGLALASLQSQSIISDITASAHDLAVQDDDKILVVGSYNGKFVITRFLKDGQIDLEYGQDGHTEVGFPGGCAIAKSIKLDSQGRATVAGSSCYDVAIVRLLEDGQLDSSFDQDGRRLIQIDSTPSANRKVSIALQSDQKIVLSTSGSPKNQDNDFIVMRFLTDGSLDTQYADQGVAHFDLGLDQQDRPFDIALDSSDNSYIVGVSAENYTGASSEKLAILSLDNQGKKNVAFANSGILVTQITNSAIQKFQSVAINNQNQLVIGGTWYQGMNTGRDLFLQRYSLQGDLDSNFGTAGTAIVEKEGQQDFGHLELQSDGKILVSSRNGRFSFGFGETEFQLLRLLDDGQIDSRFGDSGYAVYQFNDVDAIYHASGIGLQSDGKIATAVDLILETLDPNQGSYTFGFGLIRFFQ